MANVLTIATTPVSSAAARRGAPRKLFRGISRTLIRKTLAKLRSIMARDARENTRAAKLGYDPALITDVSRSATNNAFKAVQSRLQACLSMAEGDE